MPLQNRVLPTGDIVATSERGLFMGNRGILHNDDGRLGSRRWAHQTWICCALEFKERKRQVMAPGRYTELFFLDEAVALAAGHRPCAECRRKAYERFRGAWVTAVGSGDRAAQIDRRLHVDRVRRDWRQVRHDLRLGDLSDGAFVLVDGRAHLLWHGALRPFSRAGYGSPLPIERDAVLTVLTPRATLAVLKAGYTPHVHPSAAV
ncbi:hypothetical protein [Tropicimonas isoalkanivorans]|uniref:Metal binding domain of Ada n=1 Tax=Tropicimonas isoalkanivorans TaxID=441112 RepID=A0A1I1DKV6_9RHOB|nr:hypothetical protein [Tropicimonas isoalkanivorans]SFB75609.1 hypothetical protein SAMN04488094_101315 [Tropicimonas isoalkanivorans]